MQAVKDWLEIIKIRILVSALLMSTLGYVVGTGTFTLFSWTDLGLLSLGSGLIYAAAAGLNHVLESGIDAQMERTQNRPLPQNRLSVGSVLAMCVLTFLFGSFIMLTSVSVNAFWVAVATLLLYDFVYTPLKKISWMNTFVGGVPGALPLLCGWYAAQSEITPFIFLLFTLFFLWQLPHFFSIAWINKESYQRAGLKMISLEDESGAKTSRHMFLWTMLFVLLSYVPVYLGQLGLLYAVLVTLMHLYFLKTVLAFSAEKSVQVARRVLRASIVYPPLLLVSIGLDYKVFV